MADNQIEIDVVLNADQAEEGFEKLEKGSEAVGESFGSMGKAVSSLGGEANQALGTVGESLGGVVDGFGNLASAAKTGEMSFSALAGPIGVAVVALFELVQAFKEYSSEVDGASIKVEAYQAAAGELTSIIEQLSDAQVKLNKADIEALRIQSQRAQALTEEGQLLNEKGATLRAEIALQQDSIKELQKKTKSESTLYAQRIYYESIIYAKRRDIAKLESKLAPITAKADSLAVKGAQERLKLTEAVDDKLKDSPEARKKVAEVEAKLLAQARVGELQATKDTVDSQIEIARLGSLQKIREINAIEDISQKVRNRAVIGEEKRLQAEITKIRKGDSAKGGAGNTQRIAIERQTQAELKIIRELGYQQLAVEGAQVQDILEMRYQDELKQAEDNQNLKLIAEMRYQNALTKIQTDKEKQDEQLRLQDEQAERDHQQRLAEQRESFIESTMAFDAQRIEDQTTRELALLDIRYQKEFGMAEYTQEQITELQRRQALERQDILDQSLNASIEKMKGMTEDLAKTSTSAIYQSLVDAGQFDLQFEELKYSLEENVGRAREEMINAQASNDIQLVRQKEEEITNITKDYETQRQQIRAQQSQAMPLMFGQILKGLGQEAAVESMMETAKGISALFTAPALAGNHFAAAGVFAGAAALAGAAGAGLTNSANTAISRAGRGGGGGGALSPLGSPQTAPSPQREEAETSSMVFNINFGGAVIYDTQRAAEQAMADRITTLQNTRRRGAPRRSF